MYSEHAHTCVYCNVHMYSEHAHTCVYCNVHMYSEHAHTCVYCNVHMYSGNIGTCIVYINLKMKTKQEDIERRFHNVYKIAYQK